METGNQALNGLIREISRQWHDLALPPVTDWDLFETLLDATRRACPDAHASAPATVAALLAARSKLAQAGNAQLAGTLLRGIDEELVRLRHSGG